MAYQHRARKVTCGHCSKQVAWFWNDDRVPVRVWKCDCGARNHLKTPPKWPDLPRVLYIGPERTRRFKVYALPPELPEAKWAQPYSVRSFVSQASRNLGGCSYSCQVRGTVMDEAVFTDICCESGDEYGEGWDCHIIGGWSSGQTECPLWQQVASFCQNETERRFLHQYLGFVKDRQFPMLVPQAWIGIAERRRPDFVAFVPLSYWNYKWLAIQLDGAHTNQQAPDDAARDEYIASHRYEVISLRPNDKGYFEEVRSLVERIDGWMNLAETAPWEVAVEAEVARTDLPVDNDEIPF